MKKILGISLVAVLAVTPLMASADDVTLKTFDVSNNIATTSYVKGAYNDLAGHINTKQDKINNLATIEAGAAKGATAVQTVAEGTANGTIKVDGTDVNVHGLGSAAYANTEAFDAAGSAATAEQNAKAYASNGANLTAGTVAKGALSTEVQASLDAADSALQAADLNGYAQTADVTTAISTAKSEAISAAATDATSKANAAQAAAEATAAADATTKANAAEKNAKDYADSLASNYDAAGSAADALQDAKDYADELNTALSGTYATQKGVEDTINNMRYTTSLSSSTVTGSVSVPKSGTVKVLNDWEHENSEGTAAVTFVNQDVALADGTVSNSAFSTTAVAPADYTVNP